MDTAPKPPPPRVQREIGRCRYCGATDLEVIAAYDDRVYRGWACPTCILEGKASDRFAPESREMRPIVFVARGVRGDQPFAALLESADVQRANPRATAEAKRNAVQSAPVMNRKARRAAEKRARVLAKRGRS